MSSLWSRRGSPGSNQRKCGGFWNKKSLRTLLAIGVFLYLTLGGMVGDNFTQQAAVLEKYTQDYMHGQSLRRGSERQPESIWKQKYKYHPPQEKTAKDLQTAQQECGSTKGYEDFFTQGNKVRSSEKEDLHLFQKLFQQNPVSKEPLVYLEMGAFDGLTGSNSRFFDVCLGWEGILIEANPPMYDKLLVNRPHAHRLHFAPSCSEEEASRNKTISFHALPFLNAAQEEGTRNAYQNRTHDVMQVPCGSLTPVLLELAPHIHLFSLDVEGAEPMVLENLDFTKVQIDVMISESQNNFCNRVCPSRDKVRALMKANGYKRYQRVITKSDLYIHPNSAFQLDASIAPAL